MSALGQRWSLPRQVDEDAIGSFSANLAGPATEYVKNLEKSGGARVTDAIAKEIEAIMEAMDEPCAIDAFNKLLAECKPSKTFHELAVGMRSLGDCLRGIRTDAKGSNVDNALFDKARVRSTEKYVKDGLAAVSSILAKAPECEDIAEEIKPTWIGAANRGKEVLGRTLMDRLGKPIINLEEVLRP